MAVLPQFYPFFYDPAEDPGNFLDQIKKVKYKIFIKNEDNETLYEMDLMESATADQTLNAPGELDITLSINDIAKTGIAQGNQIYIYNAASPNELWNRYEIASVIKIESDTDVPHYNIIGYDRTFRLSKDIILEYNTDKSDLTYQTFLTDWLTNYQLMDKPISTSLSGVDSAILSKSRKYAIDSPINILEAIQALEGLFSDKSSFWIDPNTNRLQWKIFTSDPETTLQFNDNMTGCEEESLFSERVTHLYAEGANIDFEIESEDPGFTEPQLTTINRPVKLSDSDSYSLDYITDGSGDSVKSIYLKADHITDPDVLKSWAEKQLVKYYKDFPVTFTANAIDINYEASKDVDKFLIGEPVYVLAEKLSIAKTLNITGVSRDLLDPKNLTFEVSDEKKDFTKLAKQANTASNISNTTTGYDDRQVTSDIADNITDIGENTDGVSELFRLSGITHFLSYCVSETEIFPGMEVYVKKTIPAEDFPELDDLPVPFGVVYWVEPAESDKTLEYTKGIAVCETHITASLSLEPLTTYFIVVDACVTNGLARIDKLSPSAVGILNSILYVGNSGALTTIAPIDGSDNVQHVCTVVSEDDDWLIYLHEPRAIYREANSILVRDEFDANGKQLNNGAEGTIDTDFVTLSQLKNQEVVVNINTDANYLEGQGLYILGENIVESATLGRVVFDCTSSSYQFPASCVANVNTSAGVTAEEGGTVNGLVTFTFGSGTGQKIWLDGTGLPTGSKPDISLTGIYNEQLLGYSWNFVAGRTSVMVNMIEEEMNGNNVECEKLKLVNGDQATDFIAVCLDGTGEVKWKEPDYIANLIDHTLLEPGTIGTLSHDQLETAITGNTNAITNHTDIISGNPHGVNHSTLVDIVAGSFYTHTTIDTHINDTALFHDHGNLTGLGDDDHSQYHNNTRADLWLTGKTTDNLTEGATNKYYSETLFDASLAGKDTDDLTEGATNLYYTEGRVSANTDVASNTTHTATASGYADPHVADADRIAWDATSAGNTWTRDTSGTPFLKLVNIADLLRIGIITASQGSTSRVFIKDDAGGSATPLNVENSTATGTAGLYAGGEGDFGSAARKDCFVGVLNDSFAGWSSWSAVGAEKAGYANFISNQNCDGVSIAAANGEVIIGDGGDADIRLGDVAGGTLDVDSPTINANNASIIDWQCTGAAKLGSTSSTTLLQSTNTLTINAGTDIIDMVSNTEITGTLDVSETLDVIGKCDFEGNLDVLGTLTLGDEGAGTGTISSIVITGEDNSTGAGVNDTVTATITVEKVDAAGGGTEILLKGVVATPRAV